MHLNHERSGSRRERQSHSKNLRLATRPKRSAAGRLVTLALLTVATVAAAQQANPPAQTNTPASANPTDQTTPPAEDNAPGKIVIHDQAEYDAWVAASNTQDPKERAEAMEAFAQKFPRSVVAKSALEDAMTDWQSAGDSVKVLEVAKELIAEDSANVRALAIVVALDRVSAAQGDSSALDELCLDSTGGMREISMWQKPTNMTDADFALLHKQMDLIFNGAAGYCALQQSNYSQARDWFMRAYQIDATNLQNIYQLAISDLEMTPPDANGFWFCAKAMQLARKSTLTNSAGGMESYCKPKYAAYHGSDQGWDAILSASATQATLLSDFAKGITQVPAPPALPSTPAQK
jgi:hypothetical protein